MVYAAALKAATRFGCEGSTPSTSTYDWISISCHAVFLGCNRSRHLLWMAPLWSFLNTMTIEQVYELLSTLNNPYNRIWVVCKRVIAFYCGYTHHASDTVSEALDECEIYYKERVNVAKQ